MFRLVAVASALLLVAACSDDDGGNADSGATTVPATSAAPGATGDASATTVAAPTTIAPRPTLPKPSVPVPATLPTELVVTDLVEGTGDPAEVGDVVVVHYVGVRSADGVEFDNSYDRGAPFQVNLGEGRVVAGWDQGLVGVRAGGQRRLDIPAELAYGAAGQGEDIPPNTPLSFVVDVLAVVPPVDPQAEPALLIAPSVAVPEVVPVDLVEGTGPAAEPGMTATFSYIFYRADTGEKLYSSWDTQPATIPLVPDGSLDGLIEGIVGMKVGGRRQITVPASMVFGGQGEESLGLPAGVDLVMVADLLATY